MKISKSIILLVICGVILYPFSLFSPAPARAQTDVDAAGLEEVDEVYDLDWEESEFDPAELSEREQLQEAALKFDLLANRAEEFKNLFDVVDHGRLIVSEDDIEAVKAGQVDERILKALVHLVTPVEQGGAGFERLKIKRLIKGYATEKRALSRETKYPNEGEANISAHYFGQAADISEIDLIKTKKKTKKKLGGFTISSKTSNLPSIPIKVAWQSEKGKGEGIPGFYGETANELFDNLSLASLKEVLGDYVDYNLEKLQGKNLPEWAGWLGAIILFEDYDLPVEGFVEDTGFRGALKEMGRATLAEHLGIDKEAIQGNSSKDLILNIGRSRLEKKLNLEQGSLTGDSLEEIFKSAGKRKLEKQLKLKKGVLDGDAKEKLKMIKNNPLWKTYKTKETKNEALDMPEGSAEQIEAEDENGLVLVGAGVILYTLAVENKKELLKKIKNKEPITSDIKIGEADLQVDIDVDVLKKIASRDKNQRQEALKSMGQEALNAISLREDLSLGITQNEWNNILSDKTNIEDFILTIGARKYENGLNLPKNGLYYTLKSGSIENLMLNLGRASLEEQGKNPNRFSDSEKKEIGKNILKERIADRANKRYKLDKKYAITDQDIVNLLNGKWQGFAQKIAGVKLDKALGFPQNGVLDLITGAKNTEQILKESGAIRFGRLLGLSRPVAIEGNLKQNYGQALVEDNLGLVLGSFSGAITEVEAKNGAKKFKAVFENPKNVDAIFGIAMGTTQDLLAGKITVADYSKKVAEIAVAGVAFDKLTDYFQLERWKNDDQKNNEFKKTIAVIQGWENAPMQDKMGAFSFFMKVAGHSFDEKLEFDPDAFASIITDPSAAPELMLTQGMRKLNKKIFDIERDVIVLHYKEGKGLDFKIDNLTLGEWAVGKIKKITGIEDDLDALSFLVGDIKGGFAYWGLASLIKEANETLPEENQLAYAEAKLFYFGDPELEEKAVRETLVNLAPEASEDEKEELIQTAKVEVRSQLKKDFQYLISDAFLRKLDPDIPVGFTKAAFEGTPKERTKIMGVYLANIAIGDKLSLTPEQKQAMDNYIKDRTPENFDALKKAGVFGVLDGYLKKYEILNIPVIPGFSEALLSGLDTGDYSKLKNLYSDWAENKVFAFADKKLKLPAGGTFQIYEHYKKYNSALQAYKTAVQTKQSQAAINAAKSNLKQVKLDGINFAAELVFSKSFAKLDQKLGLPPGATSGLVTLLITGNPVGLVLAIVSSFIKVKVEFYGEIPICEQTAEAKSKKLTSLFAGFFGSSTAGYEKLSGDPEKDFPFYQRHAQCSVKRLVGALLEMPEKTGDKTLRPTQILVLRPEDVDYYADEVFELYGKTKMQRGWRGLFANDLMWEWIHLGY